MDTLRLPPMEPHHATSIRNLVEAFERDPAILALILGGSLAHGFAKPDSDIDVAIVVDAPEFARRREIGQLHYNNRDLCAYEGGYIDGKYMDMEFLRLVAAKGSEPARFAFQDSRILFSRAPGLEAILAEIVRYPAEGKRERIDRFVSQLLAWRWYYSQAERQQSPYLACLSLQKIALFSGRIVLAENELLHPYHKWLLRVLETAPRQPPALRSSIDALLANPSWERVDRYCRGILAFAGVDFAEADAIWPTRFMKDTELKWMDGEPHIDDL